jgi:hypothetical protein
VGEWVARTPQWVTPRPAEVEDFHWLAFRVSEDTRRPWVIGAAASIAWVRGGRVGPITDRDEQPVEENHARAELWTALTLTDQKSPPPPLALICQRLKVPAWAIVTSNPDYAGGVWRCLRWLLGADGQVSPLPLPLRQEDGQPVTAQQLITAANILQPGRYRHPEQRLALNTEAVATARRYRELVNLIDETRSRYAS